MTITTQPATAQAPATKLENIILPTDLLCAAASFLSTDATRPAIQGIHLRWLNEPQRLQIEATNGFFLFRVKLPPSHVIGLDTSQPDTSRSLYANKGFQRGKAKSNHALIANSAIHFFGTDQRVIALEPLADDTGHVYPNVDQFFAQEWTQGPCPTLGWNANYMATISKVLYSLSNSGIISFHFNSPILPMMLTTKWGMDPDVLIEVLLMPCQIKN